MAPGGSSCSRPVEVELLALHQAAEALVDVGLLEAGRRQQLAEVAPDALGAGGDLARLGHVVLLRVALAVFAAALDPEDQQDDDEDGEGDEADQPQERREACRAAQRPPRAARRSVAVSGPAGPAQRPLRRLLGRRLLEEVELDVVVTRRHGEVPGLWEGAL